MSKDKKKTGVLYVPDNHWPLESAWKELPIDCVIAEILTPSQVLPLLIDEKELLKHGIKVVP